MTAEKWSASLSTVAALVIVLATFRQWWDITYEGGMKARPWVRPMLVVVALMLVGALVILVASA